MKTEDRGSKGALMYSVPIYTIALVREREIETLCSVGNAENVAQLVQSQLRDRDRECLGIMILDAKNNMIGMDIVSVGTLTTSLVHPREIFKSAILLNGASVIIFHNHPSGDTTPSEEDRLVTLKLVRAGRILGIPVLDHVIVGYSDFVALRDLDIGMFN